MSKAVVIMGAGASADFGVPTLRNIFTDREAQNYLEQNASLLKKLQEYFWEPRGHDLRNSYNSLTVEEMLTILRDWELGELSSVPTITDLPEFRKGLYILIKKAVYNNKDTHGRHLNQIIEIMHQKFEQTTWASFNWDCIFEASFWYRQPYCGPGSRSNPSLAIDLDDWYGGMTKHKFLKLHGAINWWLVNGKPTYFRFSGQDGLNEKWDEYERNPLNSDDPIILEPSAYKYDSILYEKILKPQWDEFYQRLLDANIIIIIGYSFAESDVKARLFLTSAFHINKECKWLIVDNTDEICSRYRRVLGEKKVVILHESLASFNNNMREKLRDAFPDIDFSEEVKEAN